MLFYWIKKWGVFFFEMDDDVFIYVKKVRYIGSCLVKLVDRMFNVVYMYYFLIDIIYYYNLIFVYFFCIRLKIMILGIYVWVFNFCNYICIKKLDLNNLKFIYFKYIKKFIYFFIDGCGLWFC